MTPKLERATDHARYWKMRANAVLCVYNSAKLHSQKKIWRCLEPEIDFLASRVNRAEFIYYCRRAQAA